MPRSTLTWRHWKGVGKKSFGSVPVADVMRRRKREQELGDDEGLVAGLRVHAPVAEVVRRRKRDQELGDDKGIVAGLGVHAPVAEVMRQRKREQELGDDQGLVAGLGVHAPVAEVVRRRKREQVVSYRNIHIRTGVKMLPNSRIVGFVS